MLDFTRDIFGFGEQIKILATTHLTKSNIHIQIYTVVEVPREFPSQKMVACHTMP